MHAIHLHVRYTLAMNSTANGTFLTVQSERVQQAQVVVSITTSKSAINLVEDENIVLLIGQEMM